MQVVMVIGRTHQHTEGSSCSTVELGLLVYFLQVKRVPGSSGRVHKNTEGEWVWSDDEMKDDTCETGAESVSTFVIVDINCILCVSLLYTL